MLTAGRMEKARLLGRAFWSSYGGRYFLLGVQLRVVHFCVGGFLGFADGLGGFFGDGFFGRLGRGFFGGFGDGLFGGLRRGLGFGGGGLGHLFGGGFVVGGGGVKCRRRNEGGGDGEGGEEVLDG